MARAITGEQEPVAEEPIERFTLNKPNLFSMVVESDNMEPTNKKGSIVVVDPDHLLSHDGIYVVRVSGCYFVSRVQIVLNGYMLINDNPEHGNIKLNREDLVVIGHVEWQVNKTYS